MWLAGLQTTQESVLMPCPCSFMETKLSIQPRMGTSSLLFALAHHWFTNNVPGWMDEHANVVVLCDMM